MPSPVLLLHSSLASGAQWRTLAASLGARYQVLAPDLIGYGAAAQWSGEGRFHLRDEAAAIHALLDGFDEPAHLVGHSYGGAVALHIARTQPGLLRSLVLIEPSAFHLLRGGDAVDADALREITAVAADAKAALAAGDYHGGFGRFVDYWSGPGSWAAMAPEQRERFAPQLIKVVLDFDALLGERAGLEDVRNIALPALLVQGGSTKAPSRCICRRLRDALPAALRIVPGAGHMAPITHRDEVNHAIAAHLDSLTRRSSWKTCREANATQSA